MKRVKLVLDRPNRLFEAWLEEWRNEAAHRNSELSRHFAKALQSLRKYPLPLASGKECIILQHFGTKLCLMLDRKLKEHREEQRTIDAYCSEAGNDADCLGASRKEPVGRDKLIEMQEKKTAAKGVRNPKKTAPKRLLAADETAPRDSNRQISLEPNTFDIILLVDTQETCG